MRQRSFLVKFLLSEAKSICIVVNTSNDSSNAARKIRYLAEQQGIQTHLLSVSKINPAKLSMLLNVDCFIYVACPEFQLNKPCKFVSAYEAEIEINPTFITDLYGGPIGFSPERNKNVQGNFSN